MLLAIVGRRPKSVTPFLHEANLWALREQTFARSTSTRTTEGGDSSRVEELENPPPRDFFLRQVEQTVTKILSLYDDKDDHVDRVVGVEDCLDLLLPPRQEDREAVAVARHLDRRVEALRRNHDCPRCWMQHKNCICSQCPPVDKEYVLNDSTHNHTSTKKLNRIFVVMHHKEIGLKVDTAKLILAAFPTTCRLVVSGMGPDHQASMEEMMASLNDPTVTSLILYPDDSARTLEEIVQRETNGKEGLYSNNKDGDHQESQATTRDTTTYYDLVVLDGTWAQARKMHARYFGVNSASSTSHSSVLNVQLSSHAVHQLAQGSIERGHQLRRHSIAWRQVGTFEATLLFLEDWERVVCGHEKQNPEGVTEATRSRVRDAIGSYQKIANEAARWEMGSPQTTFGRDR